MNKDWILVGTTALGGFLLATGCSLINAPSEVKPGDNAGGSSASGVSSSSSSGVGGIGGIGGMGGAGGNMMACQPGSSMPCYEGMPGTAGIGECRMGMATCLGDGSGYGTCEGQVINSLIDKCATPLMDENCDGVENDGCPGEQLALVAAAPLISTDEVRSYLMATMKFINIDVFDASLVTPTVMDLKPYQSVLVFSDKAFFNPVVLGDVLADYYDGGGRVVLAVSATVGGVTRIQGRFGDPTNGYMITDTSGLPSPSMDDALGKILEPQSLLMRDVSSFSYVSAARSAGGPINGPCPVCS